MSEQRRATGLAASEELKAVQEQLRQHREAESALRTELQAARRQGSTAEHEAAKHKSDAEAASRQVSDLKDRLREADVSATQRLSDARSSFDKELRVLADAHRCVTLLQLCDGPAERCD